YVLTERLRAKVVARVEVVVAQKLEERSVQLVRARAGEDFHLRAGVMSVLGRVCAGMDLELLNGFDRGSKERCVVNVPRRTDAVVEDLPLVLGHAIGADGDGGITAAVLIRIG